MSAHITYDEGSATLNACWDNDPPEAIVRFDPVAHKPFLTVDLPGDNRDGLRLELDAITADKLARAIRRALTEYRKRAKA